MLFSILIKIIYSLHTIQKPYNYVIFYHKNIFSEEQEKLHFKHFFLPMKGDFLRKSISQIRGSSPMKLIFYHILRSHMTEA